MTLITQKYGDRAMMNQSVVISMPSVNDAFWGVPLPWDTSRSLEF
ncbi:MAG: hypothetical protein WBA57_19140 [Elainellaceae cyanobacterium]